jgi:hypothetical protein
MTDGQRVVYFGRISGFWPKQYIKQEQNLIPKNGSITNIWSNKKTKIYAYLRSYRCFKRNYGTWKCTDKNCFQKKELILYLNFGN